ncbi:hypothetical protein P8C59_006155 [Phyllachora maydis]|uniref:Uncharacterized protein n=1 Tax=Phyllachora maydis TaxID=1825666 RepID=A0AAD9I723_9PEZI|nr:hypothetical protein P8C59_006155 [Phyllachora maydis]
MTARAHVPSTHLFNGTVSRGPPNVTGALPDHDGPCPTGTHGHEHHAQHVGQLLKGTATVSPPGNATAPCHNATGADGKQKGAAGTRLHAAHDADGSSASDSSGDGAAGSGPSSTGDSSVGSVGSWSKGNSQMGQIAATSDGGAGTTLDGGAVAGILVGVIVTAVLVFCMYISMRRSIVMRAKAEQKRRHKAKAGTRWSKKPRASGVRTAPRRGSRDCHERDNGSEDDMESVTLSDEESPDEEQGRGWH